VTKDVEIILKDVAGIRVDDIDSRDFIAWR